jgi:hypothetical protein
MSDGACVAGRSGGVASVPPMPPKTPMRRASPPRSLAALAALACVALALGGCGKGARTAAGPTAQIAPVAPTGAVGLATRNTTRLGGADPVTDAAAVARTVYPGLTPATRPQLVVVVDEHNWPAALAASSLAAAPLHAPLLYSDRGSLPDVSATTLQAMRPLGATALAGAQVLRIASSATIPGSLATSVLQSSDAPGTAAGIAQLLIRADKGRAPRQVIIVPVQATPALAMPAAGLSAESGAPILYVTRAGVPAATAALLSRLHRPSIYVLDSVQTGPATLRALRLLGRVTELAGTGAAGETEASAANSVAVARFTDSEFGWGVKEPGHGLVFANAARPLDAPAAAPLSATGDYGPLLLLEAAAGVPTTLGTYLADIQPAYTSAFDFRPVRGVYNHGWLIGDESAISAVTQAELDASLQISPRTQSQEEQSVVQAE